MKLHRVMIGLAGVVLVSGLVLGINSLTTKPTTAEAASATTLYKQWQKVYVGGKTQKYVKSNNGQGTTTALSEGQGYGMLATVLAAKKGVKGCYFLILYRCRYLSYL